ncbi:MAG TPA: lysylphosphatidylglycerol synthase domain-containing protein [Balneolaceae bacterium]|nr:lysylphosphatidylglycerol synthase domain-containing protein [Balneolaceae bacterium]
MIGLLIGLGILGIAIYWTGYSKISKAMVRGGPKLFLLVLFYPVDLLSRGYGWKFVFPGSKKYSTILFITGMWFAQSVNRLVPTANIGGLIIRGRYFVKKGADEENVIASLVADRTFHGIATVVILILGALLILKKPVKREILAIISGSCLFLIVSIYVFIRLQRSYGISRFLDRWAGNGEGLLATAEEKAREVEERLNHIYESPWPLTYSTAIRVLGDILLAGEVWVAARLMNTPISILDALTLRLIAFGIRSIAFVVWGGLGVQESTYALLSSFVGLSPASLVAISLATRVREIVAAIIGMAFWLGREGYENVENKKLESEEEERGT